MLLAIFLYTLSFCYGFTNYSIAAEDRYGHLLPMGNLLIYTDIQQLFNYSMSNEAYDAKIGEGCLGILDLASFECQTRVRTSRTQANGLRAVLYPNGTLQQIQLIPKPPNTKLNYAELQSCALVPRPTLRSEKMEEQTEDNEIEPSFFKRNWYYFMVPAILTLFLRTSQGNNE